VLHAQPNKNPLVGAPRWDAWYVQGSEPTIAVERSLAPPQYQSCMPFFTRRDAGNLSLPALSPNLMTLEIEQASYAGLDFWAFVAYPSDSPMSVAMRQYLATAAWRHIRFFDLPVPDGREGRSGLSRQDAEAATEHTLVGSTADFGCRHFV
jgi:hypothetical protein